MNHAKLRRASNRTTDAAIPDRHPLAAKGRTGGRTSLILPLILCGFFGETVLASAEGMTPGLETQPRAEQINSLQIKARSGNLDAMYWLAMLHIEGTISNANYEEGLELLRTAAGQGHEEAGRMWAFIDNSFSGEGC
jgi:TPR repeat protein